MTDYNTGLDLLVIGIKTCCPHFCTFLLLTFVPMSKNPKHVVVMYVWSFRDWRLLKKGVQQYVKELIETKKVSR